MDANRNKSSPNLSGGIPYSTLTSKNFAESLSAFSFKARDIISKRFPVEVSRNESTVFIKGEPQNEGDLEEAAEILQEVFSSNVIIDCDMDGSTLIIKLKSSLVAKKMEELLKNCFQ